MMMRLIAMQLLIVGVTVSAFSPLLPMSRPRFALPSDESVHRGTFTAGSTALFARRGRGPRGPVRVKDDRPPMNDQVPAGELRVVTPPPDGKSGKDEPLGVMTREEALAKALELGGLDLVLVNPQSSPPVCRIVDYSKYRYSQEKKAKEVKKNSKTSEVKEVKMSYKIDVHDYGVRKKNAEKFLAQGNRVKCTVMFRGREIQHDSLGFELLDKLATDLDDVCLRENKPKREGRNLSVILGPKPEMLKKINESRRAQDKAKKQAKTQAKEERAAAAVTASSSATAVVASEGSLTSATLSKDGMDLDDESGSSSSLDDLFGGDDLTDDLFG